MKQQESFWTARDTERERESTEWLHELKLVHCGDDGKLCGLWDCPRCGSSDVYGVED